jgi:hypothetical protein
MICQCYVSGNDIINYDCIVDCNCGRAKKFLIQGVRFFAVLEKASWEYENSLNLIRRR